MTLVNDALLKRLARLRLTPRWAVPTAPDGERRGKQPGSGMEFTDHREYHAGDDLRHLDVHAYGRLQRPYVKLFASDRGLDTAILVDSSPSMAYGSPTKLRVAAELATALAYIGISAGDRVRLGSFGDGQRIAWRPVVSSTGNLATLVDGLDRPMSSNGSETNLRSAAAAADSFLPSSGLTVVLSDWWTPEPELAVRAFARSGRELVVVQLLSPEEHEPGLLDEGWTRLVDAELGDSVELSLEPASRRAYELGLARWRERITGAVDSVGGSLLTVRTDREVANVLLTDWRRAGLVT